MTTREHQRISDFLMAVFHGDKPAIAPMLSDNVVWHTPRSALPAFRKPLQGKEATVGLLGGGPNSPYVAGSKNPELQCVIIEGDKAAARYRMRSMLKVGRPYENQYCMFFLMKDGLITEAWEHVDSANLYAQMGVEADWLKGDDASFQKPPVTPQLSASPNARLAVEYLTALYGHDKDAQARLLNDDLVWHTPASSLPAWAGQKSRDDMLKLTGSGSSPFEPGTQNARFEISLADGDLAAVQLTMTAKMRNGRAYENGYAFVFRCRDGGISEVWEHPDTAVVFATAGIDPIWLKEKA